MILLQFIQNIYEKIIPRIAYFNTDLDYFFL